MKESNRQRKNHKMYKFAWVFCSHNYDFLIALCFISLLRNLFGAFSNLFHFKFEKMGKHKHRDRSEERDRRKHKEKKHKRDKKVCYLI